MRQKAHLPHRTTDLHTGKGKRVTFHLCRVEWFSPCRPPDAARKQRLKALNVGIQKAPIIRVLAEKPPRGRKYRENGRAILTRW